MLDTVNSGGNALHSAGSMTNHGLPLLSTLPERFARRCWLAPSVGRLESDLSPDGNATVKTSFSVAAASPFA
jgi:hypothetical protein